jgi:hypothetical protein
MAGIGKRLHDAASIGNVSELENIALELPSLGPEEATLGSHIGRLTTAFDFPALLELAERLERARVTN